VDAVLRAVPAAVNEPVNPATGQVGGLGKGGVGDRAV